MSIILGILPMLIIVAIIMFITNKQSSSPKKTRLTSKFTTKFLVVYVFFLLASTVAVAYILPSKTSYETVTDQEETNFYDDIYNNLYVGKEEDVPSKYVLNEWSKKMDGDTFTLKTQNVIDLPISIMIERVESSEELVEATLYKGIYVVDQIKIRNYLENIEGDWLGDVLTVKVPKQESVSMTFFQYDFTFTQFSGNESMDNSGSKASQYPVLYIKVPKSLKLNVDEGKVYIVQ